VPSAFKHSYSPEKEFRYIWMSGDFDIEGNPKDYYGLSAGRIRLTDRIYMNNKFIDSLPSEDVSWNPQPRNCIIPGGVLTKGKNRLYVYLGAYAKYHGGIMGDALIQPKMSYRQIKLYNIIMYKYVPIGMIFIFAFFKGDN
jgi:hypothetical protein